MSNSNITAIGEIPKHLWEQELEITSGKFHVIAAWVAIICDPIFAITDYFNIGEAWLSVFYLRLGVVVLTAATLYLRRIYPIPSAAVVAVPLTTISLQNAYTYTFINNETLLGHNLNYVALLIGAGMFVVWSWRYSLVAIFLSALATTYFVMTNPLLTIDQFFLKGGLILIASAFFMTMLIRTRYNLTVREIKARIALQISNDSVKALNENLESTVEQRTAELKRKNKALEEYAFINAHKLRRPLASILGLLNLMNKTTSVDDQIVIRENLNRAALELEAVVGAITSAIDEGTKK